jgi:uncharacterized protein
LRRLLMVDIEKIQAEIVQRLLPLNPQKIILFGSYADGTADEDSDIDLLLVINLDDEQRTSYEVDARMQLRDLNRKYNVGFDILSAPQEYVESREDFFYKVEVLSNGKVLYAQ